MHDLEILVDSGRQLIVLETEREGCFIEGFKRLADRSTRSYFQWTVTQGLLRLAHGYEKQLINTDVNQLFAQIKGTERAGVYILVDFHHYLKEPVAIRHIKDTLLECKQHCLILLSQKIQLPDELSTLATHYSLPLPTTAELVQLVNNHAVKYLDEKNAKLKVVDKGIVARLVKNLCGLSHPDAERLIHHAIYNDGVIDQQDIDGVVKQKFELLNKNNVLSLELDYAELDDIAGFYKLKEWLALRKDVFLGNLTLPGGDLPKGLLLLGVQGCGKSLSAKAVAGSWGLPLLHLDIGRLYNRWQGQSEENLRLAIDAAEKMAPCVMWIDEIEKGMSAVDGSDDTAKRMLATFLTWLSEKSASVFVVATANNVSRLPPELIRKGRFDEVFFVDLPDLTVREQILKLHIARRDIPLEDCDLTQLGETTEGFSGAELEQLVVAALYQTINNKQPINTQLLLKLANNTKPLSVLMAEQVNALRVWAQDRAVTV